MSDSPTMKRLLGWPHALEQGDVFKIPPSRAARASSKGAGGELEKVDELAKSAQPRARQQERPRPRAVTASAASKNLFNRREVNLARRPGAVVPKKPPPPPEPPAKSQSQPALVGRGTKRKSVSPRSESFSLKSFPFRSLCFPSPLRAPLHEIERRATLDPGR